MLLKKKRWIIGGLGGVPPPHCPILIIYADSLALQIQFELRSHTDHIHAPSIFVVVDSIPEEDINYCHGEAIQNNERW